MRKTLKNTLVGIALGATLVGLSSCGESSAQQKVYDKQGNSLAYTEADQIQKKQLPGWFAGHYWVSTTKKVNGQILEEENEWKDFRIYNNDNKIIMSYIPSSEHYKIRESNFKYKINKDNSISIFGLSGSNHDIKKIDSNNFQMKEEDSENLYFYTKKQIPQKLKKILKNSKNN